MTVLRKHSQNLVHTNCNTPSIEWRREPIRRCDRVNADACVFFRLWLQKPLRLATANPSGTRLADAVKRCIDLTRVRPVLEPGAGTESLTESLVRAGCSERIITLEPEPALVTVF